TRARCFASLSRSCRIRASLLLSSSIVAASFSALARRKAASFSDSSSFPRVSVRSVVALAASSEMIPASRVLSSHRSVTHPSAQQNTSSIHIVTRVGGRLRRIGESPVVSRRAGGELTAGYVASDLGTAGCPAGAAGGWSCPGGSAGAPRLTSVRRDLPRRRLPLPDAARGRSTARPCSGG